MVVCDMHPGYNTTIIGKKISHEKNISLLQVQHHHAHAVACMAENKIEHKILSVILDGSGYGSDNKIWGSEFLICDYKNFIRDAHFDYFPLPGGEKAIKEDRKSVV